MTGKSVAILAGVGTLGLFGAIILLSSKSELKLQTPTVVPTLAAGTIERMKELGIEDIQVGTGSAVKAGDTVVMHYTGTLINGAKFDSSLDRGQPFVTKIGVGAVIAGWDQGVPGMKVGGKRKLLIPAALGYGSRGAGGAIPPDSDLIFEVELLEIRP